MAVRIHLSTARPVVLTAVLLTFRSFPLLCRVFWYIATDISKKLIALIFRDKQPQMGLTKRNMIQNLQRKRCSYQKPLRPPSISRNNFPQNFRKFISPFPQSSISSGLETSPANFDITYLYMSHISCIQNRYNILYKVVNSPEIKLLYSVSSLVL